MIYYTEPELINLMESLKKLSHGPYNISCVAFQFYKEYRIMQSSAFVDMLRCRRKRDFCKLELGNLRYFFNDSVFQTVGIDEYSVLIYKYIDQSEFKEIFDVIFLLEIERLPLFINDFSEIATWRMRIGK